MRDYSNNLHSHINLVRNVFVSLVAYVTVTSPKPQVKVSNFIATSANIVGDVSMGLNTSIWYGAVIRGQFL